MLKHNFQVISHHYLKQKFKQKMNVFHNDINGRTERNRLNKLKTFFDTKIHQRSFGTRIGPHGLPLSVRASDQNAIR